MDAHAHLLSLGWAGPGHSLDSRPYQQKGHRGLAYDPAKVGNNGTGLVKPLLVSQRKGRLGVGKKSHEPQAGNEWWLKGFESALGNIGKSESERSSGASTPVPRSLYNDGGKHGGLYTFFVKGQRMQGTIGPEKEEDEGVSSGRRTDNEKKRKSDHFWGGTADEGDRGDSTVKNKKQKRTAAAEFEQVGEYLALRDRDSKRRKRTERPSPVEEFKQVGEYLAARTDENRKKKDQLEPQENEGSGASTPALQKPTERTETKEERRERRRKRKEEKERRQRKQIDGRGGGGQSEDVGISSEDAAAKEARRSERKKRKAAEKAGKSAKGT